MDIKYAAPHRRKTDAELLEIPGEHFPCGLSDADQDRWLRLVPEDRLYSARDVGCVLQPDSVLARVIAAIDRIPAEKHLLAAQATVPPPPELKKSWYRDGANVKWAIGVIVTISGILAAWFRSQ